MLEEVGVKQPAGNHGIESLRACREQNLLYLIPNTFSREVCCERGIGHNGKKGILFDFKPEPGRKTEGAQHAQRIFFKTLLRAADSANDAGADIVDPVIGIDQNTGRGHRNGIDGKITPAEIGIQISHKTDMVRVAMVQIFPVVPEGCNLHKLPAGTHGKRPMFDARRDRIWKQLQ